MRYTELDLFVVGQPYSGCSTSAKIIHNTWKGFRAINMDSVVDELYNEFIMIKHHQGAMRRLIRRSVILKNSEYLYRSIGIPEFISSQFMWEWQKYVDEPTTSAYPLKKAIYDKLMEFNPNWRKIFARQQMIENPTGLNVFYNINSLDDLELSAKPIIAYVDTKESNRVRLSCISKQGIPLDDFQTKEFKELNSFCIENASIVLYNNNTKASLERQLEDLREFFDVKRIN